MKKLENYHNDNYFIKEAVIDLQMYATNGYDTPESYFNDAIRTRDGAYIIGHYTAAEIMAGKYNNHYILQDALELCEEFRQDNTLVIHFTPEDIIFTARELALYKAADILELKI